MNKSSKAKILMSEVPFFLSFAATSELNAFVEPGEPVRSVFVELGRGVVAHLFFPSQKQTHEKTDKGFFGKFYANTPRGYVPIDKGEVVYISGFKKLFDDYDSTRLDGSHKYTYLPSLGGDKMGAVPCEDFSVETLDMKTSVLGWGTYISSISRVGARYREWDAGVASQTTRVSPSRPDINSLKMRMMSFLL